MVSDRFKLLTKNEVLEKGLDEYIIHCKKNHYWSTEEDVKNQVKNLEKLKSLVLDHFSSIKSKIKLQDIRDDTERDL